MALGSTTNHICQILLKWMTFICVQHGLVSPNHHKQENSHTLNGRLYFYYRHWRSFHSYYVLNLYHNTNVLQILVIKSQTIRPIKIHDITGEFIQQAVKIFIPHIAATNKNNKNYTALYYINSKTFICPKKGFFNHEKKRTIWQIF